MKQPSYDADMRAIAKNERLSLVTMDCDCRTAGDARATMQAPVPKEVALEMWKAVRAIYDAHCKDERKKKGGA